MKNGWQHKPIGDLCEVIAGQSPEGRFYNTDGNGTPFYQGKKDFGEKFLEPPTTWTSEVTKIARRGDILMSVRAPVGPVNFATDEICIGRGLAAIRSKVELNRDFLFYQLIHLQPEIAGREGAVFASINKSEIEALRVAFAPLPEQKRIVGILDEAFAGIATAKANAEKNLQNARALFESHLQSVFTQRGPGWKTEKLDALTDLARGQNPPKSKFSREQKPGYVRFYQIRDGSRDDYAVFVPDTPQLHKVKKDDILMVAYRHVGRVFRGVEGAFNVALCRISNARRDILDDDYLFHIIPSPFVKGELLKRSERSLIPSMSIEHLREIEIPLPPLRDQQRIVKSINGLKEDTQRLEAIYQQKLAALEALKKSLLHQAFTGELTLADSTPKFSSPTPPQKASAKMSTTDLHAGILAMAYQMHENKNMQGHFTHVKAEKISHMVEARLELDLGRNPVKDAAGPNDFPHLHKVEHRARNANYFDFKQVEGGAYHVVKLHGFERLIDKTRKALDQHLANVEHLLLWMLPMNVRQAEIVATIYAAWNNLLLDGRQPTDEEIVREARENWHPDKLKIERIRFFKAVSWLRKENVVPEGKGKRVVNKGA